MLLILSFQMACNKETNFLILIFFFFTVLQSPISILHNITQHTKERSERGIRLYFFMEFFEAGARTLRLKMKS